MKSHIVTGIGCFAQPQKLSRVFLRMVKTYSLGQIGGADLVEGCRADESETSKLIKALIDGGASESKAVAGNFDGLQEHQKITGFYLALNGNNLKLSIFARNRTRQPEIHSAKLTKLTRLRQKRLN